MKETLRFETRMFFPTIACGIFSVMLGVLVVVGWHTQNQSMIRILPNMVPMQYNGAVGFGLSGFGLIALRFGQLLVARFLGCLVFLLGLITLAQYVFRIDLLIDQLFVARVLTEESAYPGRMAAISAFALCVMGLLLLSGNDWKKQKPSSPRLLLQILGGSLLISIGCVEALRFFLKADVFFGLWRFPEMPIIAAADAIVLGVGIITFAWSKENYYIPVILILVLGTMLSLASYFSLSKLEQETSAKNFQYEVQDRFSLFKSEVNDALALVESLWAFYDSSIEVDRSEFYNFTQLTLSEASTNHSLAWVPWVPHDQRQEFEKSVKEKGEPGFVLLDADNRGILKPASHRDEYFPIQYMESRTAREFPIGFNLGSLPSVARYIRKSRDTGKMIITERITDPKVVGEEVFVLALKPVYQKTPVIDDSILWRRAHFRGFVVGTIRIDGLLKTVLSQIRPAPIDVFIYDKSAPFGQRFLAGQQASKGGERLVPISENKLSRLSGLYHMDTIDLAGRRWLFLGLPAADYFSGRITWLPWVAFFVILYVSLLLAYYLWANSQHTVYIEGAVKARTAELSRTNERLENEIREKLRTEGRLREMSTAMENAVEGISELDDTGKYIYANKAYATLFGFEIGEVLGRNWEVFVYAADTDKVKKAYQEMFDEGKAETEMRGVRKDGSLFHAQLVMVRTSDAVRKFKGCYFFVKDISERKAKQALEIKSELITMVSHELRSPLHSVREGISILQEGFMGELNQEQQDTLATTKKSIDRLVRLVNNVLDFQKLEAGMILLHPKKYDANELLQEIKQSMDSLANHKGLVLEIRPEKGLPLAEFDWDRLTQVMHNLTDNAIRFTDRGKITLSSSHQNGEITLSVADTGIGIPAEDLPKLFKKYGQINAERQHAGKGTGLGLMISKKIVEQHGGRIWAESKPGAGTVFFVEIPLSTGVHKGG